MSKQRWMTTAVAWFAFAAAGTLPAAAQQVEPVPVTEGSTPFFAAATDFAAHGYVEQELLVSGEGNVYEYAADGSVYVAASSVPYKTRILVRRPQSAAAANGVVLFELLNPTAGFDIDFVWQLERELLLEEGYVWVGLTMKDTAVSYLRGWDPGRYGDLEMPDRGLAYDMFAQIGALLRDPGHPGNPLADLPVEVMIGTAYSQSSDYLTTFSNEFHAAALTWDGRHVFDGYLHGSGGGTARRINSASPELYTDERRFNRVAAPLIRVQSETEVAVFSYPSWTARQGDSELFRVYEVAGASHADREVLERTGEVIARDVGGPVLPPCAQPLSSLRISPVYRASLENLRRWIVEGAEPPASRLIELDDAGQVVRDAAGNALGGVRLPPIEAPTGEQLPSNAGPGPCILAGTFLAFDEPTLEALYPSPGHYLARVVRAALGGVRDGFLRWPDAFAYIFEAAHAGIHHSAALSGVDMGATEVAPPSPLPVSRPESAAAAASPSLLDQVHRLAYRVPVGGGRWLSVGESFTLRSWLRSPRRAVVFLNGSVFRGNHFTVPYPGYDGPALAAERGFFAFTVDYLGVGDSFQPQDGWEASFEDQVEAVGRLLRRIRSSRGVGAVDVVGEGYGAGIGTELAADPSLVRSLTASAQIYREVASGPLLDEDFIALLAASPDGYFSLPGDASLPFLLGTPQPVVDYVLATQGGRYPVDNLLAATERPFYDPAAARAPALVLYGGLDEIAVRSDLEDLVAEWGAPATLVVNDQAGHAPRLESPPIAAWFWQQVFAFLDP